MKYSEKLDEEEITQKEDKNSDINDNITNYEENQNNCNNNKKKTNIFHNYYLNWIFFLYNTIFYWNIIIKSNDNSFIINI